MAKFAGFIALTLVCWSLAIYFIVRAARKGGPEQRVQADEGNHLVEWETIVARSLVLLLSPPIVAIVGLAIWYGVDDKKGGSVVDVSVILGLAVLLGPVLAIVSFLDGALNHRGGGKRRS